MKRFLATALLFVVSATPAAAKPIHPCEPWPDCSSTPSPVNPGEPKDPTVPGIKELQPPAKEQTRSMEAPAK